MSDEELRDQLALSYCSKFPSSEEMVDPAYAAFRCGWQAARTEGVTKVLGLSLEEVDLLKKFYTMHTGRDPERGIDLATPTQVQRLLLEREDLKEKIKNLEAEIERWRDIEKLSGADYKSIYANVYKLKPGKYAPKPRQVPSCNCSDPENIKVHDEICDILEENAYNEADVCTASVGIWAALAHAEQVRKEVERLRGNAKTLRKEGSDAKRENADAKEDLVQLQAAAEKLAAAIEEFENAGVVTQTFNAANVEWRERWENASQGLKNSIAEYRAQFSKESI